MIVKYVRISDKSQNTDRQKDKSVNKTYTDVISGRVKFVDRPAAKQLIADIEQGLISTCIVQEVSRLGRTLLDVLTTLQYMQDKGVNVHIHNIGMNSLIDGKPNPAFTMVVTILANISQAELSTLRERQAEGVRLAKERGAYKGREKGSKITPQERCAGQPEIVKLLRSNAKGTTKISYRNIAKITKKNLSTVQRVADDFKALGGKFYYNPIVDPFAS